MTLLTALNLTVGALCVPMAYFSFRKKKKLFFLWMALAAIFNLTVAALKIFEVY